MWGPKAPVALGGLPNLPVPALDISLSTAFLRVSPSAFPIQPLIWLYHHPLHKHSLLIWALSYNPNPTDSPRPPPRPPKPASVPISYFSVSPTTPPPHSILQAPAFSPSFQPPQPCLWPLNSFAATSVSFLGKCHRNLFSLFTYF